MASHESNDVPPPLIMVGMHRSGTSLAAALLQSAGLDIGTRLMEGNWSNPRGHFEDMDFVEFQRASLARLGCHHDGWVAAGLPELPSEIVEAAREIVERKGKDGRAWGFKDPRTILFLRLWLELLPNARLLLIYRAPWEVINSLYRRGDEAFARNPEFAVFTWHRYNRTLLDTLDAMPERCLLASLQTISAHPAQWVARVRELSGAPLTEPDTGLYDPSLLHGGGARGRIGPLFRYYPEVIELYAALESRSWRPADSAPTPLEAWRPPLEAERRLALADWQEGCANATACERLEAELRSVTERLRQAENAPLVMNGAAEEHAAPASAARHNGAEAPAALAAASRENGADGPAGPATASNQSPEEALSTEA